MKGKFLLIFTMTPNGMPIIKSFAVSMSMDRIIDC